VFVKDIEILVRDVYNDSMKASRMHLMRNKKRGNAERKKDWEENREEEGGKGEE
jgi:hypothetical protein